GGAPLAEIVAIDDVEPALLAAADHQMRMPGSAYFVGKKDNTGRTNVKVFVIQVGVVEGSEIIDEFEIRAQLDETFAEVGASAVHIEGAIAGDDVNIARIVGGRRGSRLPQSRGGSIGGGVEDADLTEGLRGIPQQPAVIVADIAVRREANVNDSVEQKQPEPLLVVSRIEGHDGAAVPRARHGCLHDDWAAGALGAGADIKGVEAMHERTGFFRRSGDVDGARGE